ncbi:MAG: hypothetical protein NTX97_01220 [Bacteroidetes bacterium]|nr:hypothetical protein [Bacteroidota bacterium]
MRKIFFYFLISAAIFSSCKKEKDGCPKCGAGMYMHFAYVKGYVLDSITGMPIVNAKVYDSDWPFKGYSLSPNDSTDATGMYVRKVGWWEGTPYGDGWETGKPADSADVYVNAYTGNICGFFKFKGYQLIENDTITISNINSVEDGYITMHIKDIVGGPSMTDLHWYYVVGGNNFKTYDTNTDTLVTFKVCPYQKIIYTFYGEDSATVNSGDTAFVDVFY